MIELKENERIDYLLGEQLKIIQDGQSFAFSLDTLLLAYWAKEAIKNRSKVVELCSGNAAASLYMAAFNKAHYDDVELQEDMVSKARRSVELNDMQDRITVHQGNVKDAGSFLRKDSYDVVVVNPPYFKAPAGHKLNSDRSKAIARHELEINLEEIIAVSAGLLKMKGKMFMVHRPERLGEIINYGFKHDLAVKTVQPFVSRRGQDANLVIVEAVRSGKGDGLVLRDAIEVHEADGSNTPAIKEILEAKLPEEKHYFYVLLCSDGSFYGGYTNDLKKRLDAHNSGKGAKYTKSRRPVEMIYLEEYADKRTAMQREYWFKHHDRAWKEKFLHEQGVKF
ncbi:methyltransferase [Lactobacillus delbrueckii subsp. delbrueckii DSM 20074 = JCM 1012]|uniref:GIY-YIG nuclease family protein n=1 Tax=Lactobacillus delbrueckii TaxID=1584 RepID=UPI000471A291|nr:GIY-YIG nuclease family protein [Lactobacillus delbrueckii]APP09896.1 methyltransferase [Lactobacillus delbrueckii subsp. delbrueckii DSM 20074 = JCM 1012]KNZ37892.1 methyltransferase [Lactobacillus delbrueckii subsp. delbrueckii]KRK27647.1 methyltransferase [Lactobacillus delbrueckii subsp. delbrueckii DSM 20074 = JCM 1012]MCT3493434.1 methyltransferase [Lactobacillus delbrueckii]MCT3521524.1 methyltransferase [Lactobacillus delbrueckii]